MEMEVKRKQRCGEGRRDISNQVTGRCLSVTAICDGTFPITVNIHLRLEMLVQFVCYADWLKSTFTFTLEWRGKKV